MSDGTETQDPTGRSPGPPPHQLDPGSWQLRRSVRDRKLKGVAAGVAAAADVEPNLVRLLFAVAALSGWGIVAYIALAVVLRDETYGDPTRSLAPDQRRILRVGLGVAAVVAVGRLFDGWFLGGGDGMGLPLVLIAIGAALLWARRDASPSVPAGGRQGGTADPSWVTTGPPTSAHPTGTGVHPADGPPGTEDPAEGPSQDGPALPADGVLEPIPPPAGTTALEAAATMGAGAEGPAVAADGPLGPPPFRPDGAPVPPGWPVGPPPPRGKEWRSTGRDLFRLAAAFVAVGVFLLLLAATFGVVVGAVPMRLPLLPLAIGIVALVALVALLIRGAGTGRLTACGVALVVAAALALGLTSWSDGTGDRTVTISAANPLLDRYDHDAGQLVLDLARLPLAPGETRRTVAEVGAGELTVILPREASVVDVRARVGAGVANVFGRERGGPGLDVTDSNTSPGDGGRLALDLKVGVGAIRVVPPEEATFRVSCSVPEDALGAAGPVTCPHPLGLASTAMTCSVVLADPGGGAAGQGFCRRLGAPAPPAAGAYATTCTVPADSDAATCAGLSPSQLIRLQGPPDPDAPPATALSEETTPTTGTDVGLLRCGPPEADGSRTCTGAAPAATTTTAPATYRCIEAQDTRQLTCVPALG